MIKEELPKEDFDFDDENIYRKEDELFQTTIIKSNFVVYFYVKINNIDYTFPIELTNIDNNLSLINLKKILVKEINKNKLEIEIDYRKYFLCLKENDENVYKEKYELRNCKKKNHFPKYELPALSDNSIVENIIGQRICILSKSNDVLLLNPVIDENENEKKFEKDNYHSSKCIIM